MSRALGPQADRLWIAPRQSATRHLLSLSECSPYSYNAIATRYAKLNSVKKVALLVRSDGLSSKTSGFAILGANILRTASEPVWSRAVDHRFVQEQFIGAVLDAVMANYLIQGPPLSRLLLDSARAGVPTTRRIRPDRSTEPQ